MVTSPVWALPLPVLLQETDSSSAVTRTYLYGSDLLAEEAGPEVTWPLPDALGTPLAHVNQAGALTTVLNDDPWGVRLQTLDAGLLSGLLPFPAATSGLTPTHTFTGEPTMGGATDDGLVYLRARWYDPTLGRFLQRDPLERIDASSDALRKWQGNRGLSLFLRDDRLPLSLHPYTYVLNNPLRWLDPLGLGCNWWDNLKEGRYFGTSAGEAATQWYAQRWTETGNPLYAVGGAASALWTPETWLDTATTLAGGYAARVLGPFSPRGVPRPLARIREYIRFDRPHHGKGWEFDGKIPKWFRQQ